MQCDVDMSLPVFSWTTFAMVICTNINFMLNEGCFVPSQDRQTAMPMSPPCKLHRWAKKFACYFRLFIVVNLAVVNLAVVNLIVVNLAVVNLTVGNLAVVNLTVVNLAVVNLAVVNLAVVNLAVVNSAVVNLTVVNLTVVNLAVVTENGAYDPTVLEHVWAQKSRISQNDMN